MGLNMAEKFDPAAHDKHAANPREAASADRDTHTNWKPVLIGSFPASDPSALHNQHRRSRTATRSGFALGQGHGGLR